MSKKENVIQLKTYDFALNSINLYKKLKADKREFVLSKQMIRSATSIGANVEEAIGAQSKKDFISKMMIAYKETRETHYWLRLLHDSEYIEKDIFDILLQDCNEILKILTSIIKKTKDNA